MKKARARVPSLPQIQTRTILSRLKAPFVRCTQRLRRLYKSPRELERRNQLLLLSLISTLVVASIFILAALRLFVLPLNFVSPSAQNITADVRSHLIRTIICTDDLKITFAVELISIDPISRTIVTDWYPNLPLSGYDITCGGAQNAFSANILFNPYVPPPPPSFTH